MNNIKRFKKAKDASPSGTSSETPSTTSRWDILNISFRTKKSRYLVHKITFGQMSCFYTFVLARQYRVMDGGLKATYAGLEGRVACNSLRQQWRRMPEPWKARDAKWCSVGLAKKCMVEREKVPSKRLKR